MNSNQAFFVGALGALMISNLLLIPRDLGVAANLALLRGESERLIEGGYSRRVNHRT